MVCAIFATDECRGFGLNNKLPWSCSEDLKHFKATTSDSTLIMGINTWNSIPQKAITKNRTCIVVSSRCHVKESNTYCVDSFENAINLAKSLLKNIFVIGGKAILLEAFTKQYVDEIVWSVVKGCHEHDISFHEVDSIVECNFILNKETVYDKLSVYNYKRT
jgi:dihydrofolate reductase